MLNSFDSLHSNFSVDEDYIRSELNNLEKLMADQRDELELEDDDWDLFDQKYKEITNEF